MRRLSARVSARRPRRSLSSRILWRADGECMIAASGRMRTIPSGNSERAERGAAGASGSAGSDSHAGLAWSAREEPRRCGELPCGEPRCGEVRCGEARGVAVVRGEGHSQLLCSRSRVRPTDGSFCLRSSGGGTCGVGEKIPSSGERGGEPNGDWSAAANAAAAGAAAAGAAAAAVAPGVAPGSTPGFARHIFACSSAPVAWLPGEPCELAPCPTSTLHADGRPHTGQHTTTSRAISESAAVTPAITSSAVEAADESSGVPPGPNGPLPSPSAAPTVRHVFTTRAGSLMVDVRST